jgi:hypothetical protein
MELGNTRQFFGPYLTPADVICGGPSHSSARPHRLASLLLTSEVVIETEMPTARTEATTS